MNTFGGAATGQQYPLYDPRSARENRTRFRRDHIPLLDRANSLCVPSGRHPTRGWILMARADYNKLNTYSNALQLNIGDPRKADNVATLGNLSIVQAQCVTRGLVSDLNALYLVELTDDRGVIHNDWFQAPLTAQYNIRAPAYPQTFHPASMNGGTTWTWATMLADMWARVAACYSGATFPAWPGLPAGVTPAGTPEGYWFNGVPGWYAINDVLEHLGMTVACDLTSATPLSIVQAGAADAVFAALQTQYITHLEDDQEWIDTGAGRVPRTVTVLFNRRNSVYGSEETVRRDGPQWTMSSYHAISVSASAQFGSAIGRHHLWDNFTIRYDQEGNPLGEDVAVAQAIAVERAAQYFARIYRATLGRMSRTYAGALPFTTGSQVDGVCWHQTFTQQARQGWKTQIMRGMDSIDWCSSLKRMEGGGY